jgi:hypothetical protein
MSPFRGSSIYGGYGIYGAREPDPRDYRTHPIIERQLLDPVDLIWTPGNIFLRLHPEYLYPCLGERIVCISDVQVARAARKKAARELESLRRSIRKYFKRSHRPPGRPPTLTPVERRNMASEHTTLSTLIRSRCSTSTDARIPHAELNRLFRDVTFQKDLFAQFPLRHPSALRSWNRFLTKTASMGISSRALRILGLRYGVSHHTIHRAIWTKPPLGRL